MGATLVFGGQDGVIYVFAGHTVFHTLLAGSTLTYCGRVWQKHGCISYPGIYHFEMRVTSSNFGLRGVDFLNRFSHVLVGRCRLSSIQ